MYFVWGGTVNPAGNQPGNGRTRIQNITVPPYKIHVWTSKWPGPIWVRGPPGRQRARPASILNMPPRAPPVGVCAAEGVRRSRTSLAVSRRPRGGPHIFYMGVQTSDHFSWTARSPNIRHNLYELTIPGTFWQIFRPPSHSRGVLCRLGCPTTPHSSPQVFRAPGDSRIYTFYFLRESK